MMMNLEEIPIGYRFNPTDEEIITYYLRMKVEAGEDMTWFNHVISEQDLYGELPPWVIFDQDGGGTEDDHIIRYFYTRLKRKHETGKKIHRTVGKNGEYCWDGQDKGSDIYDHRTMTVIGKRKLFSLIRSDQKKGANANTNSKKRKKSSNSKDIHEDDGGGHDKSFGNWIMHEYSLVNPPSSSPSSNDNQNYVICRIRMKEPPKPTTSTTTGSNATTHRHDSINSSTTTAPALPSCTSTTTHGYQNMSNQMLHDQQQQEDYLPGAAHVAVPPLVLTGTADYQINHQDQGYLLQHAYDDKLFLQDDVQQQQQLVLMYDQEQPAATMEVSLESVSEWEGRGLDNRGGGGSSSHDKILDNNNINHDHDELLQVDNLFANMEVPLPVLLSNSMVDQEEENRVIMNNEGGRGGGETTSNHLDYSTTMAAGSVDNLDDGWTGLANTMLNYDTIMNLGNGRRTGLDYLGHDQNNYDTIMNSLKEDTVFNDLIWENHWECPFPPSPQPPSGSQFCNVAAMNRS